MKGLVFSNNGEIRYKFDTNSLPVLKNDEHVVLTENIDAIPVFTPKPTLMQKIKKLFRK